jgi:hypothetical protein
VCFKQLSGSQKVGQILVSFLLDLKATATEQQTEHEQSKAFLVIGCLSAFFSGPHANENRSEDLDTCFTASLPVLVEYLLHKEGDELKKAAAAGCIFSILVSSKNGQNYESLQIKRTTTLNDSCSSIQDELNVRGIVVSAVN